MRSNSVSQGQAEERDTFAPPRVPGGMRDVNPIETHPTFTLTFALGTSMREIHNTVIRTVLQHTRGNRLRAAKLLRINPRTIRRRLGRKESAASATRAA